MISERPSTLIEKRGYATCLCYCNKIPHLTASLVHANSGFCISGLRILLSVRLGKLLGCNSRTKNKEQTTNRHPSRWIAISFLMVSLYDYPYHKTWVDKGPFNHAFVSHFYNLPADFPCYSTVLKSIYLANPHTLQ